MAIRKDDIPRVADVVLSHMNTLEAMALVHELVQLGLSNKSAATMFERLLVELVERNEQRKVNNV